MNNKLDEINRGIFRYQLPELIVSQEMIELSVGYGENYTGSIEVSNSIGTFMKGVVYSSHEKVRIMKPSFGGVNNTIEYEFDKMEAVPGDEIKGNIDIVSDCGEYRIPFCFTILEDVFQSSVGQISDLTSFTKLAEKDFQEALIIFNSPQFVNVVLKGDVKNELLYRSLIRGNSKSVAMEEFLVVSRKKTAIMLSADKNKFAFEVGREEIEDKIVIKKNTWGFVNLNVSTDCEFIKLEAENIGAEDFVKDKFELKFSIDRDKLDKEENIGTIFIDGTEQSFKVSVTCNCTKNVSLIKKEKNVKSYKAEYIKNYLDFRTGKLELNDYLERSNEIVQNLCILDTKGLNELLRIHLYIVSGQKARAIELLSDLEQKLDEMDKVDAIERCGYLYLKTLVSDDDIIIRISVNTILNFYEGESKAWQILWILLYINKKYDSNLGLKVRDIKEQFDLGCTSPIMYYEACGVYNKECTLLNTLSQFEIQVINWGANNDCVSEDVALAYANLAVRIKEFNNIVYKTLVKLYEKYGITEILSAICSILIKGEKYNSKYFKWFSLGVKEQLKITYLYEGYMYSYDESINEQFPESVLIYFNYNSNLADSRKAYLYANVIRNKRNNPKTYESYATQIKAFMLKQLSAHIINENMKVIYEDMLTEDVVDEEIAKELPYIMFRHDVFCYNPNFTGIVVVHKILSLEQYANFNDGKAQVNIFADGTEIFLVDKYGNRYAGKNAYTVKKLLNCDAFVDKCFELNPNDGMLIIHIGDRIDNYIREDFPGLRVRKKLVDVPHLKEEYKRKYLYELIKYTYDNGETDLLDHYLYIINTSNMNPKERSYIMEYLILRGFREKVLEAINKYGFSKIPVERLVKLATKSIESLSEDTDKDMVLKICAFAFENKKYDENILNYLVKNYNGSTRKMYDIWKAAYEFQLNTTEIEERILAQVLFTEGYVPDVVEIFRSYYRNYNNIKVVKAFLMYNSYKYIVKDRVLSEAVFDIIKKELSYQNNDIYSMALLKYYSTKEELSDKELEFVENTIKYFGMNNIILPFFKEFGTRFRLPEYISDKYYVGYIADPDIEVKIHYRLEDDKNTDEFTEETMRNVFLGIRVKEFILFFGDNLQYYVVEKNDNDEVITESFNICIDDNDSDEESRYNKINFMLMTRDMNDEVTLIETMKSLATTDYIADSIFKPL